MKDNVLLLNMRPKGHIAYLRNISWNQLPWSKLWLVWKKSMYPYLNKKSFICTIAQGWSQVKARLCQVLLKLTQRSWRRRFLEITMSPLCSLRKRLTCVSIYMNNMCLVNCLFRVHRPDREFFTQMDYFIIAGEGLLSIYARHLWPLSSEGSLTCHTNCDTGLPFIMVISEDPWHSHLLPSVWLLGCHYLFLRFRSVATGIEPRSPACEANALPLRHRGGLSQ